MFNKKENTTTDAIVEKVSNLSSNKIDNEDKTKVDLDFTSINVAFPRKLKSKLSIYLKSKGTNISVKARELLIEYMKKEGII